MSMLEQHLSRLALTIFISECELLVLMQGSSRDVVEGKGACACQACILGDRLWLSG